MPFPDSLTHFDRIDSSSAVDIIQLLTEIKAGVDDNTADLSDLKNTGTEIKTCVNKLCTDDVLEAVNDQGWRVLI